MIRFLWVCLGGALGTGARYLLSDWVPQLLGITFPYATLIINILGCFLIGIVMNLGPTMTLLSSTLRLTLAVGFIGGFTTYSTFNYQTLKYMQEGAFFRGVLNLMLTVTLCLAAGVLGVWVARVLFPPS